MYSVLDIAVAGGLRRMTHRLLDLGAPVNLQLRPDKRTPLHWALTSAHTDLAYALVQHGADLNLADANNVTGYDLIYNPGLVTPDDALHLFNITQRPFKQINRVIHPEQHIISKPKLSGNLTENKAELRRFWQG